MTNPTAPARTVLPARAAHRSALAAVAALLAALSLALSWAAAPPAHAHAQFLGSTPGEGETAADVSEIVLEFNEPAQAISNVVVVTGPEGEETYEDGLVLEGNEVRVPLAEDLAGGEHTVTWRVVSADGHPIDGEFAFTVEAAEQEETPEPEATTPEAEETTPAPTQEPTEEATTAPDAEQDEDQGTSPWAIAAGVAAGVALLGAIAAVIIRQRRG